MGAPAEPRLVYLHGLNSSGASAKATYLREHLPLEVLSPTYPAYSAPGALDSLLPYLRQLREQALGPLVLVGSSMGGFYGQHLAREVRAELLVLINPALMPWELLPSYLGPHVNPTTGEHYELTMAGLEELRRCWVETVCDGVPTLLLLDRGDEVIDYRIALDIYRDCGEVHLFEGGNHAFSHMADAVELIHARLRAF